jgi:hypothetical protein
MPESVGKKNISSSTIVSISVVGLAIISLWIGWCLREQHLTAYSFLVNLAAGLALLFIATLIAVIVARRKLKHTALPILKVIQQLESDDKISHQAARKSVMAVVAILSESNVSRAIKRDPKLEPIECPVCRLKVELNPQKRCKHCLLPDALWHSKELIENAPPRKREGI